MAGSDFAQDGILGTTAGKLSEFGGERASGVEVAAGGRDNDGKMAGLIETLASLVPAAVSVLTGIFSGETLSGLAGGATKYVIGKLRGR